MTDDQSYTAETRMPTTAHCQQRPNASRILSLSQDAIAQIHSSKQITSLQGVVLALLQNSLDGNANKVDISFTSSRGACAVEDNGSGIPPSEFLETGGLGKMYHTSKSISAQTHELHGNTGSYLASLSALSLLSITSLHPAAEKSSTLTLHQGRVLARQVPSSDQSIRGSHGTRVSVKDLFGNMPVRVKQRALAVDMASNGNERGWNDLKYGIVALLLAWRAPCSVRLQDVDATGRSLTLSGHHASVSAALTEKSLNQLSGKQTRYDLRDALPVIFQAGLAPYETRTHWIPISASTLQLSIRGSICLDPAPTKACQFISIGVRPCSVGSGYSELYESINRIFANSSFGSLEEEAPLDDSEKDRRKRDRRYKADGYTQKQIRGGKGIDRWPMFVLQIKLRDQQHAATNVRQTRDHQLKNIIDVLEAMVEQWLAANDFRPRKRRKRRNEEQRSPAAALDSRLPASSSAFGLAMPSARSKSLRRVATADGSMSPRGKKRIINLSGDSERIDISDSLTAAMPNSWSRIKSGREQLKGDLWVKQKPLTAPSGASGSTILASTPREGCFNLPVLKAGSLASENGRASIPEKPKTSSLARLGLEDIDAEATVSSDYFGSMSDGELIAGAEVANRDGSTEAQLSVIPASEEAANQDEIVDWVNPITRQTFKVNSRTGVVLPPESKTCYEANTDTGPSKRPAAINTATTAAGRPLTLSRRAEPGPRDPAHSAILPKEIREWQNPVFAHRKEEQIPITSISGPGTEISAPTEHRCSHDAVSEHFAGSGNGTKIKMNKADLAMAKVINQVDRKFILCSIPASPNNKISQTLILIDQHAASERIILETLLTDLCAPISPASPAANLRTNTDQNSTITTTPVQAPSHFEISSQEHALFLSHAPHFARWGILYNLFPSPQTPQTPQTRPVRNTISILALPPAISERCTLFPKLLIGLLRAEIWSPASHSTKPPPDLLPQENNNPTPWLRAIGTCPKGLRDMLASRACRSAVMFNDVLTKRECQGMVEEMAKCVFPFVCAHGRVGVVPVVAIGEGGGLLGGGVGLGGGGREVEGREEGFGEVWKRRGRVVRGVEVDGLDEVP